MSRGRELHAAWLRGQGAKIKEARPLAVYGACSAMARRLADTLPAEYTRVLLTLDQIGECDSRAVSSARVLRFGALPQTEEEWRSQVAQIRADWAAGT